MKKLSGYALALAIVLVFSTATIAMARFDQFGGSTVGAASAPFTTVEPEPYAPYTAGPVVREEFRPYAPYTAGPVVRSTEPYAPYTAGPVVREEFRPYAPYTAGPVVPESGITLQYERVK